MKMTDSKLNLIHPVQPILSSHGSGLNQTSDNKIAETESDITLFTKQFKTRVQTQVDLDIETHPFILFDEVRNIPRDERWLHDNRHRFFKDTPNEKLVAENYLSELGYICCMTYSPDGLYIITGHSTGLIQVPLSFLQCVFYHSSSSSCYVVRLIDCYCTFALIYRFHDLCKLPLSIFDDMWFEV